MPSERLSDGIFPCVLNRVYETPDAFGGNVGCCAMFGGRPAHQVRRQGAFHAVWKVQTASVSGNQKR
ncbi:hypothetical protein [Neisseria gonorrhoeae]|uniref:hypothetical protein n=1 Tax=Neisseria gonorrhoeae TaxID=485 RepID=UPI001CE1A28F